MLTRIVNRLEEGVISLLLVGMTLLVFIDVVLRFVFSTGFLWMEELTLHVSAWMVLFGASYGLKVGAHIGVDAVVRLIPPGPRRWVSAFAAALCLAYCGLFLYGGWIYLAKVYSIHIELQSMGIQAWVAHSILIIGFGLLAVRSAEFMVAFARGRATTFRLANEAADALEEVKGDAGGRNRP
jgi:C4-dicarboxylate transporter DctQ subunit